MDDNILAGLIASSKSPKDYAIVGETLNVEPIAIMIRKDDPAFKKAVDDSVKGMMQAASWTSSTQVVHEPDPAEEHQREPADERQRSRTWATPNDKPAEDLRQEVSIGSPRRTPAAHTAAGVLLAGHRTSRSRAATWR